MDRLTTADGRTLEVLTFGPPDGTPLVYHSGTPSAAVPMPVLERAATAAGARVITWSRPGYAGSTEQPGRTVSDVAADAVTVLDGLDVGDFVALGWSGGGPHALACAALLPDRCRAATVLAGAGPYGVDDLDFLAGMAEENQAEFGAAIEGRAALEAALTEMSQGMGAVTAEQVAESLGGLVSESDIRALTGELAEHLADSLAAAVSTGIAGWRDDDLAFVQPWGFDLAAISIPVAVWQGEEDRMVPLAHGQWIADNVSGARLHQEPDHGHISVWQYADDIVAELLTAAGR
jgi:pimeloyl-ACP methyl ester carboxylesterase